MKRFRRFVPTLSLFFLALLAPESGRAVQRGCGSLWAPYVAPGKDLSRLDLSLYRDVKSVLFLSDGLSDPDWFSLGKRVSEAYPAKRVVSGDFNYRGPRKAGNLELASVNNLNRFPFESDSFDMVVLRRGLCVCDDRRCCGGFSPLSLYAKNFFREAVRVMNKANPRAKVILHGSYGVTDNVVRGWTKYLEEIEEETGVRATLYFEGADDHFLMIGIVPGPSNGGR